MLRFTWDEANAAGHQTKHKVSFETAARVFLDPFALSEQDRVEEGEYRWQTIGSIEGTVVLVAHTVHEEADRTTIIHIISARGAVRYERRRYEEEKYRQLQTWPGTAFATDEGTRGGAKGIDEYVGRPDRHL